MKDNLLISCICTLLFFSCKKSKVEPEYPIHYAYIGTSARHNDTSSFFLTGIGHVNTPTITKMPKHAIYGSIIKTNEGFFYKYLPNTSFKGVDTIMFKSIETSIKKNWISTFYINVY